jgi:hypothetical protein
MFMNLHQDTNGRYFFLAIAFLVDIDPSFIVIISIMSFYHVIASVNVLLKGFSFHKRISFLFERVMMSQQILLLYIVVNEIMMFIFSFFRLFTADKSFVKFIVLFNHLKFKFATSSELTMVMMVVRDFLNKIFLNPSCPPFLTQLYRKFL